MLQDVYPAVSLKQHSIWQGEQPPEPCAVVIFGAMGDLTQRKQLPMRTLLPIPKELEAGTASSRDERLPRLLELSIGGHAWRANVLEDTSTVRDVEQKATSPGLLQ